MAKSYYAGMELDAPCGRCKSETTHRILSITDGVPEKIICVVCRSTHKFREEKPAKPTPTPRVARVSAVSASRPAAPSPNLFQELMIQEQAGAKARPYSAADRWDEGTWIDHPSFGLGKVQHRAGRKINVLFREGVKILISG